MTDAPSKSAKLELASSAADAPAPTNPLRSGSNRVPGLSTDDRKMLWDEYKLLQDKIDRVGDFRFRVKQWAVTLVLGVLLGGTASRTPWWLMLICALIVNIGFALMEVFHHWSHSSFAARVRRIELLLTSRDSTAETGEVARGNRPTINGPTPAIATAVVEGQRQSRRRHPWLSRVVARPSFVFYGFLVVASTATSMWQAFAPTAETILKVKLIDEGGVVGVATQEPATASVNASSLKDDAGHSSASDAIVRGAGVHVDDGGVDTAPMPDSAVAPVLAPAHVQDGGTGGYTNALPR